MRDILEFTSLKGTNFLLAWHKIVSIAFIKTDEENATPPCAIIRIENAGTIERQFATDEELEQFRQECRLNMSHGKYYHSGVSETMNLTCPINREKCLGIDCAVWVTFSKNCAAPMGYCGLLHSH